MALVGYMIQEQIKQLIDSRLNEDGIQETGIEGVQLFRVTQSMPCVPAVYEPSVIAIASGAKVIWDFHEDNMIKFWMPGAADPEWNLDVDVAADAILRGIVYNTTVYCTCFVMF